MTLPALVPLTAGIERWFSPVAAATYDARLYFQERRNQVGSLGEIGVHHPQVGQPPRTAPARRRAGRARGPGLSGRGIGLLGSLVPAEHLTLVEERSSRLTGAPAVASWARRFRWIHIDGEHAGQAMISDLRLANVCGSSTMGSSASTTSSAPCTRSSPRPRSGSSFATRTS